MTSLYHFFQSNHMLALISSLLIFLMTIFLVVKRWIGFSITLLLLFFSLAVGLLIDQQQNFTNYFKNITTAPTTEVSQDNFHQQILNAIDDLRIEVLAEKENLRRVMSDVKEIFESVDAQKQKLQHFIEETRENFKRESPASQPTLSMEVDKE